MKTKVFIFGGIVFIVCLAVDAMMFFAGLSILGLFSLMGTMLVYATGMIWFIYRSDDIIHFSHPLLILPVGLFCTAIIRFLKQNNIGYRLAPEDLFGVGNIMMSRYQVGLWLVSVIILLSFVLGGSLLVRRGP